MSSDKPEKKYAVDLWYVYILRCADDSLYTGITRDLERRLSEHNHSNTGARYTRSRRPVRLVYSEPSPSRSTASRREHQIRTLPRLQKLRLIESSPD
ncbi:MAG: hypothetical protein BMS9Abin26_1936 [Gammaproteobacteria bacterium]|nr:MAG: hypothetical protein BMS9Abin26_1936 [Gammaproteobacteria bacterium]